MCKSFSDGYDRPAEREHREHSGPFIDMSDPTEARSAHRHCVREGRSNHSEDDQISFDNPFADEPGSTWNSGNLEASHQPAEQDTSFQPTGSDVSFQPASSETTASSDPQHIAELTALSENQLPNHQNGSYPSTADWENLHSKNVEHAQQGAQNGSDLVFYGDSITEALGYNPAALGAFQKDFGQYNPTPLGLGGDGTNQLLYRVNHGELQGQPKVAVVMIGTNDLGSMSTDQIKENTANIIDSIQSRSPNTKVLLMGVLPRPLAGDPGNTMVDETNAALSQLATADGSVRFANINNNFIDSNGNEISSMYQGDGLHLSNAGYETWDNAIKGTLTEMLNSPDVAQDQQQYYPQPPDQQPADYQPAQEGQSAPVGPIANGGGGIDTSAIRGVNLDGADWGKNSPQDAQFWPTAAELDYYKSKGMNTVRLPISWEQFQPSLNGPLDQNEMQRLDNFLNEAAQRGMKVIVDLQNFDRYTLNHGPLGSGEASDKSTGTVVGQAGLPVSALSDFWTKMAQHIDANPTESSAVGGWDLMNEPYNDGHTWANTATQVTRAIRATGDQHAIVVEGDEWARDFRGMEDLAKSDPNIVFEAHSYWDNGSGGYADGSAPGDPNVGIENIKPFVDWLKANNARGFVGEWGVPTTNSAWFPAVSNFIRYLNQNGVGNIVWSGGPGWQPDYTLSVEPSNGHDKPIMSVIEAANSSI